MRLKRIQSLMLLPTLVTFNVLAEEAEQEKNIHYQYYVNVQMDRAKGDVGENEMNRRMAALGYDAQAQVTNQSRSAYYIGLGYHWREYIDLELGYRNLGKVRTELSGSAQDIDDYLQSANAVHPRSASGYEVAVRPYYPITEKIDLFGSVGLFRATSDYNAYAYPNEAHRDNNSYETVFGAGIDYQIRNEINIDFHITQLEVEDERIRVMGVGLVYQFGKKEK
jgi:hypothetical protein